VKRGAELWLSPLVALAVLAASATQIVGALGVTGAFGWQTASVHVAVPPAYVAVERALDRVDARMPLETARDPFVATARTSPVVAKPAPPVHPMLPAPAAPVLTAIVWDKDPRALVHWKDREWTVREGGLFDEFMVMSISRDQVSLRRGDATLVLQRRNPGD